MMSEVIQRIEPADGVLRLFSILGPIRAGAQR
jgi:hypothetical protein